MATPPPQSRRLDAQAQRIKGEQEEQAQAAAGLAKSSDEKDADTRQQVAKLCVICYFAGLLLVLVGVPFYNYFAIARGQELLLLDLKDTLLAYQAVVGTLVGAVVAYYFKTKADQEKENS